MIRTAIGTPISLTVERVQLCAANNAIFLRVTTAPAAFDPQQIGIFRVCDRWNIDGVDFTFSRRNTTFEVRARSPITQSVVVDLYMPMGQAVDVNFARYVEEWSDEAVTPRVVSQVFDGDAAVAVFRPTPSPVDGFVQRRRRRTGPRPAETPPPPEPQIEEKPLPLPKKKKKKSAEYKPTFRNLDLDKDSGIE